MMELGLYTDSVSKLSLPEVVALADEIGARALELATGGQSSAPHLRIDEMLESPDHRGQLLKRLSERDLHIGALNCSAWPMHPVVGAEHVELIRNTIRLASEMNVEKIVSMSGCPGDGPGASTIDWVWYPWPKDAVELLDRQWERAVDVWGGLAEFALSHGITKIALELHPLHLVYNVPTLQRMRRAIGGVIGANVDPSHMFWQQMDPLAVIRALGDSVYHVHLKDCEVVEDRVALAGVLDQTGFGKDSGRAWRFRTVGRAHGREFWRGFLGGLEEVGYAGMLGIENEDLQQDAVEGVTEAAEFIGQLLSGAHLAGAKD